MRGELCDKCGQKVPARNNAIVIDVGICIAYKQYRAARHMSDNAMPRHLLPIPGCEGSPSRAQYLKGQPRDQRGYVYDQELEPVVRAIYDVMQTFPESSMRDRYRAGEDPPERKGEP